MQYANGIALSADGKTLAIVGGGGHAVELWDIAAGKLAQEAERAHRAAYRPLPSVPTAVFSPPAALTTPPGSGNLPPAAHSRPSPATRTGCSPWRSAPTAARWPPRGQDKSIKLWEVQSGESSPPSAGTATRFEASRSVPTAARLLPRASTGLSGSGPSRAARKCGTSAGTADQVWDLAFSPDGRTIASASFDGTVKFWESRTDPAGVLLTSLPDADPASDAAPGMKLAMGVALSPDGRTVACPAWTARSSSAMRKLESNA